MRRDAEDMHASQAVGCRSESDMLSLLSTHLPCAIFKDAQPFWIKPLARLTFGTVWEDLGSEFRLPLLSLVCLFPLHPTLCEVSDSFFFPFLRMAGCIREEEEMLNENISFHSQRKQRKINSTCTLFSPLHICAYAIRFGPFLFRSVKRGGHWVPTVCLFEW